MVTAKLICLFVFAYAKNWFSHDEAHFTECSCIIEIIKQVQERRKYAWLLPRILVFCNEIKISIKYEHKVSIYNMTINWHFICHSVVLSDFSTISKCDNVKDISAYSRRNQVCI